MQGVLAGALAVTAAKSRPRAPLTWVIVTPLVGAGSAVGSAVGVVVATAGRTATGVAVAATGVGGVAGGVAGLA